jgi:soluble lytic murein transglycosylase-like protein
VLLLLAFATAAGADTIYYYKDADGVIHFTDTPASRKYKPYFTFGNGRKVGRARIMKLVRRYSRLHRVDSKLVQAVLQVESNYRARAESTAGAQGLMQIMPCTQKDLGVYDPYDPAENIAAGVEYLSRMLERFSDLETALAAYNAGPGCVERHGGTPPFPETERYVDKVLTVYRDLKR